MKTQDWVSREEAQMMFSSMVKTFSKASKGSEITGYFQTARSPKEVNVKHVVIQLLLKN